MSSKVTGDAQPDAGAEAETDQALSIEIVGSTTGAEAEAVTTAENTTPAAESESTPESSTTEPAPDEPDGTESAGSADGAAGANGAMPTELPESQAQAGAQDASEETENRTELDENRTEPTEPESAEPAEPAELAALIVMTEPVKLAEPVDGPKPRRRGHGVLIVIAFVLAGLAVVGGAFAIVGSLTHGFKKPVIIHYKKSAIFSLKTSECIDPSGQTASVVSCSTPHDAEVFATFSLQGSKWPGTAAVRTAASSGCSTRLTGYLNPQLAISLASTYIYPGSVAWQAGTRTVICEVRATSGQLTGSVRGASATVG
jgi:hypothetical protein